MTRLILIGAGGHGKVTADVAGETGYSDVVFVDQNFLERTSNGAWNIIGSVDELASIMKRRDKVFVSVGDNLARAKITNELDLPLITLIHPRAIVSKQAIIGEGSLIVAGAVINTDAEIGKGVILNTSCTVDHDCQIGDFVHVSPGANIAGGCSIGAGSWIGIGACVRQGIIIGANVMVGAGAVVVKNISDNTTVMGAPAKAVS